MLFHSSVPFTPNSKTNRTHFHFSNFSSFKPLKCSLSAVSEAPHFELSTHSNKKPFPAKVSRTIMELATVGTLSALTNEGHEGSSSPLAIGVRFAVDPHEGTPFFFLNPTFPFSPQTPSSLHVQLNQSGLHTPQCTLQGTLTKPQDMSATKEYVVFLLCLCFEKILVLIVWHPLPLYNALFHCGGRGSEKKLIKILCTLLL
ncbi:glutamyl-tRNA reductase-binding protein, chloroplastic [Arachis hypogaea]|uniref:glutamyl-tRNA reductase-binding protein, chloroplastic n=1 Tax=Arachis hypogaea TaxID=3818 RepID=UPI000DEC0617|nr:glutamyl-tRNA reductase-binding protein, chloroplastic [Arachis hypogaea]